MLHQENNKLIITNNRSLKFLVCVVIFPVVGVGLLLQDKSSGDETLAWFLIIMAIVILFLVRKDQIIFDSSQRVVSRRSWSIFGKKNAMHNYDDLSKISLNAHLMKYSRSDIKFVEGMLKGITGKEDYLCSLSMQLRDGKMINIDSTSKKLNLEVTPETQLPLYNEAETLSGFLGIPLEVITR